MAEDGFELHKWWNHEGPGLRGRTGPSFRGMEDGERAGPGSGRGGARDKLGWTLRILSEKDDVEPQESEGKSDPQGWKEAKGKLEFAHKKTLKIIKSTTINIFFKYSQTM